MKIEVILPAGITSSKMQETIISVKEDYPMKHSKAPILFSLFILMLLLAIPAQAANSKTTVSLSKQRLSVTVKKTKKIKLNGTDKQVKWSVSGKKLVTVKPKGKRGQTAVIKAGKKTGTCYVVAKVGKKAYKCRVIVKKASGFQVKSLSASAVNRTSAYKAKKTTKRAADSTFVNAMANTSVRLLQETLSADANAKNTLISPDSVLTALSVVENGASGKTLSEMKAALGGISAKNYSQYLSTLHKRITKSKDVTYQIANSLWYKKGNIKIKKPYLQRIVSYHGAEVYAAPFDNRTVRDINKWVYNQTRGKIPSIINRLEPSARTAVLNAIYFKGKWEEPYSGTVKRTFTTGTGTKRSVPMLEGTEHSYITVSGADGFVKNYRGGTLAFMGILPPKGTDVDKFVGQLKGADLVKAYRNRKTSDIVVHTRMPEFGYDYEISLEKPLQRMGIRRAFTDQADFSRISETSLSIDQILHKTHIELNRDGTEAAAVTAVIMKANAAFPAKPQTEKWVYLDRPFIYAIIDVETGLPLFLGTVGEV